MAKPKRCWLGAVLEREFIEHRADCDDCNSEQSIDYKSLLQRYIRHVLESEGSTFIDMIYFVDTARRRKIKPRFSRAERHVLMDMSNLVHKDEKEQR